MSDSPSIAEAEARNQQTALREVLDLSPHVLTRTELIRYLGADIGDPLSVEPWSNAIRELHRTGLLRSEGETMYPTMAALAFAELLEDWV